MGLFNNLGRKVEQFKQQATAAAEGEATHACAECETLLHTDHDECPECGSDAVAELGTE